MKHVGLVWLGGSLGTALRALAGVWLPVGWVASPTLVVNAAGAFLIGLLYQWLALGGDNGRPRPGVRLFLGTGVLGGFTTYSALAVATAGHGAAGAAYGLISVCLGLVACWLGLASAALLGRRRVPVLPDARSGDTA